MWKLWVFILIAGAPEPGDATPRRLTLEEAVGLALASEPGVAEAKIARERADLSVLRANLDRVSVRLDAQAQEIWVKRNVGAAVPPDAVLGLSNVSAAVKLPVFTGFRLSSNVQRAERLQNAAGSDLQTLRKDTALSVARLYWNIRRLALLSEVQARAVERLVQVENVASARVRSGLAAPIDENRAVSRRLQEVTAQTSLEGQVREGKAQLGVLLGLEEDFLLTELPNVPERAPPDADVLVRQAQDNRPEVKAAVQRLEAQRQAVRMAHSAYYPELSLVGLGQYGNNPTVAGAGTRLVPLGPNPFTGMTGDIQAGVQLSFNLFDTLQTYTATKDARYLEAQQSEQVRRVLRVAESEVKVAHAKLERLREQRVSLLQSKEVARDNLGILNKRYQNGEAMILDVLDAELELVQTERQLTESTALLHLAWLELDASVGQVVGDKR